MLWFGTESEEQYIQQLGKTVWGLDIFQSFNFSKRIAVQNAPSSCCMMTWHKEILTAVMLPVTRWGHRLSSYFPGNTLPGYRVGTLHLYVSKKNLKSKYYRAFRTLNIAFQVKCSESIFTDPDFSWRALRLNPINQRPEYVYQLPDKIGCHITISVS